MPIELTPLNELVILARDSEGHFANMIDLAKHLYPSNAAEALEAFRGFLNDYDDLDIDDEGNVYEMDADDELDDIRDSDPDEAY